MAEWKEDKLGEVAEVIDSLHRTPTYSEKGYPMVRVTDIKRGYLNLENTLKVDESTFNDFSQKRLPRRGDIVFSRVGSYGVSSLVNSDEPFCLGQNTTLIVAKENPCFLYYFLNTPNAKSQIDGLVAGSTQPTISLQSIKEILVPYPPLPEQKSIASVLSSLDDKIDLLHRQNKTLEQLAETLFRQWFVEEAAEGWEEAKIGKVLRTELGGTPSTHKPEYWDGDVPWINSGEVNNFRINKASKYITEIGLKESNTKLMPKGTVVLAITGATLGQISILEIDACANQSVVGIIPNEDFPMEFIFLWIKLKIKEIISNQTGGAQQHINKDDVNETPIIIPPKALMKECMPTLSSHFNKISSNINQICTLTKLRDTLLPKLMSGEVRVREYEKTV